MGIEQNYTPQLLTKQMPGPPSLLQRGVDAELGAYLLPLIHDKEQRWGGEERAWLVVMPAFSMRVLPVSLSTECTAAGHF